MREVDGLGAFHNAGDIGLVYRLGTSQDGNGAIIRLPYQEKFSYDVRELLPPVRRQPHQAAEPDLGRRDAGSGLPGHRCTTPIPRPTTRCWTAATVSVTLEDQDIDVSIGGPYANYNWELLYHIPVMIAVHLSNNQRFAEAQKWFHLVFDPTTPTRPCRRRSGSGSRSCSATASGIGEHQRR